MAKILRSNVHEEVKRVAVVDIPDNEVNVIESSGSDIHTAIGRVVAANRCTLADSCWLNALCSTYVLGPDDHDPGATGIEVRIGDDNLNCPHPERFREVAQALIEL